MTTASMNSVSPCRTCLGRLSSDCSASSSSSHRNNSDAVPGADLLAGHPVLRGWRPFGEVAVHAHQELPLGAGIAPRIRFEPPAPHGAHQRSEVLVSPSLLERGVKFAVVALENLGPGVG